MKMKWMLETQNFQPGRFYIIYIYIYLISGCVYFSERIRSCFACYGNCLHDTQTDSKSTKSTETDCQNTMELWGRFTSLNLSSGLASLNLVSFQNSLNLICFLCVYCVLTFMSTERNRVKHHSFKFLLWFTLIVEFVYFMILSLKSWSPLRFWVSVV